MPRQLQYLLFANHVNFNNLMLYLHWDLKPSTWIHEHSVRVTDVLTPLDELHLPPRVLRNCTEWESTQLLTLPFIEYLIETPTFRCILRYILLQPHLLRYSFAVTSRRMICSLSLP